MKILKTKYIAILLFTFFLFEACNNDDDTNIPPQVVIPEVLTISEVGIYPGKFDYDTANDKFIIGSLTRSEVGQVDPETGDYEVFITDDDLALVTGIYTDETRNRLLVASGDFGFSDNGTGFGTIAYLGIYNLETGEKIEGVNLRDLIPAEFVFANDITVDDNGNIYVTDSFNPVIYKVDGATFEASIFLNGGSAFANTAGISLAMNGIVYLDGFLIVAKTDEGFFFKVPLSDPTSFVKIDAPVFIGSDGLEITPDGDIIMVETGLGDHSGTQLLSSSDGWDSLTSIGLFDIPAEEFPTSATLANDGEIYVLTSHLSKLTAGNFTHDAFNIYRIN